MPPLKGFPTSRRNIATPFGMKKLEWLGHQMVKNIEDIFIRFDVIHERDGQTPGDCIYRAYAYASRTKLSDFLYSDNIFQPQTGVDCVK